MNLSKNTYRTIMLVARERGITLDDLYGLCLKVTGREHRAWSSYGNELSVMSHAHAVELLQVMRATPVSEAGRAWYAEQDELQRQRFERDRRATARFQLDDPFLKTQREGWGS